MQDCTPLKEVIFQEIHSYICSGVPNMSIPREIAQHDRSN